MARSAIAGRCLCLAVTMTLVATACADAPARTPPITPGTSAHPRDVNIIARDDVFSPPEVDVAPGETIILHVINGGLENHEVVIGDQSVQDAWETAEADVSPLAPGISPSVSVPPGVAGLRIVVASGVRRDVTWTVPSDAAVVAGLIIGCHVPGHYAKGMHVPIRIPVDPSGT